jgi:hypothetical protein
VTFKEGLLKARGQIAFIAALAVSTGVIVYLEALDTEQRIQSRVAEHLSRQPAAPTSVPPSVEAAIRASLRRSEEAYTADPAAGANKAAMLVSLSTAAQLGLLNRDEGLARARTIVDGVGAQPDAVLSSAMAAAAVAFPALQERVSTLSEAP